MARRNKGPHLKWVKPRNCWYIIWYEAGRERKKSTGTQDRLAAEQELSIHIIESSQPRGQVSTSKRLLADVLAAYAEEHAVHVASKATIGHNLQSLIPFFGHLTVADIKPTVCREYLSQRKALAKKQGKTLSDSTISRELGVLAAAVNHDYKQGRIPHPVPIWKPPPSAPKDRWLTRREVALLLKTARKKRRQRLATEEIRTHSFSRWHLSLFILLALYTAARKEAITSLRWSQVDLERGLIDFSRPGDKITNKRRAIVPIPNRLMTFLKIAKSRCPPNHQHHTVIEYQGQAIERIDQSFRRVSRDAGYTDVTPHTLRHTAATWMAQAGVQMWIIAKYLGHTSSRTTERVYAHHNPSFLYEAKLALEKKVGKAEKCEDNAEKIGTKRPRATIKTNKLEF